MFPHLITIGDWTLESYQFFVVSGMLVTFFWCYWQARKEGLEPAAVREMLLAVTLAGVIGGKAFAVLINIRFYQYHPAYIFDIWRGGFVFYGAFIFVIVTYFLYAPLKKLPIWKTLDVCCTGFPLGLIIGRIGCLSIGCCYGRPSDLPWAITFHDPYCSAPLETPLHPTQIYSALAMLFLFIMLMRLKKASFLKPGQLFWLYVLSHSVLRTVLEYYRGDFRGKLPFETVSSTQLVAYALMAVSIVMLIILGKRRTT